MVRVEREISNTVFEELSDLNEIVRQLNIDFEELGDG